MVMYGSDRIGYPGAGPFGCIIAPLTASLGWRRDGWTHGTVSFGRSCTGIKFKMSKFSNRIP